CTYKGFMACNPKEYDGKEVTPESSRIKKYIAGFAHEIQGMLRATQPTTMQSAILKAWILTDEAVSCGTLTKGNDKRKDPNVVTGTFSLNNHFVTVLFDSGANFSFISTKFMPLLNVKPSIVNLGYVIEVADDKKVEVDRIIRMDWLSQHKAIIVCHEKVVEIPVEEGRTLRVQGERTVGIAKTLKSVKEDEPKLGDISVVRDFEDVFPEDLFGLPLQRQVEFHIDLVHGATLIAKSPYHLAAFGDARIVWAASRVARQGFHSTKLFTVRSAGVIRQNKGWLASIVNLGYVIEVADDKKVEVDRIIRMDWLSQHKAIIVCHEKVVEIPVEEGRTLRVQGERTVGIAKALKSVKEDEPKLGDISVVRDFEDVFPEDLFGLPLQRQVEFHIDLVHGATLIAKSPYHLAAFGDARIVWAASRVARQGFHSTKLFTVRSAGVIRQNKGWLASYVH
nr:putative reverse transcriptase domain-containing protein [Tanacetum cinerariifolium]